MARLLLSGIFILVFSNPVFALEYRIYGDIHLNLDYSYKPDINPENSVIAEAEAEANHRFYLRKMEFFSLFLNSKGKFKHTLYEAYLYIYPSDMLTLIFGKQRLNWGTSYLYSPTDRLHPEIELFEQETGFPGAAFTLAFTPDIVLTTAVSIEDILDNLNEEFAKDFRYALYMDMLFGRFELFTSFVYQYEKIVTPGIGFSLDIAGIIFTGEAAFNLENRMEYPEGSLTWQEAGFGERFFTLDVGIQKSIVKDNFSLVLLGEYIFNHAGYKKDEAEEYYLYRLPEILSSLDEDDPFPLTGRHYLYALVDISFPDYIALENSIFINLPDGSFWVHHQLSVIYFNSIDFNLKASWVFGKRNKTEFGSYPEKLLLTAGVVIHY
jgi:hypothetical protein